MAKLSEAERAKEEMEGELKRKEQELQKRTRGRFNDSRMAGIGDSVLHMSVSHRGLGAFPRADMITRRKADGSPTTAVESSPTSPPKKQKVPVPIPERKPEPLTEPLPVPVVEIVPELKPVSEQLEAAQTAGSPANPQPERVSKPVIKIEPEALLVSCQQVIPLPESESVYVVETIPVPDPMPLPVSEQLEAAPTAGSPAPGTVEVEESRVADPQPEPVSEPVVKIEPDALSVPVSVPSESATEPKPEPLSMKSLPTTVSDQQQVIPVSEPLPESEPVSMVETVPVPDLMSLPLSERLEAIPVACFTTSGTVEAGESQVPELRPEPLLEPQPEVMTESLSLSVTISIPPEPLTEPILVAETVPVPLTESLPDPGQPDEVLFPGSAAPGTVEAGCCPSPSEIADNTHPGVTDEDRQPAQSKAQQQRETGSVNRTDNDDDGGQQQQQ